MGGFSAASAAERCAFRIHARPSSAAPRPPAPLRRGRRTATLAVSRRNLVVPRAVATPSDLVGRFTLDSNSELQLQPYGTLQPVTLNPEPQGSVAEINLEVANTSGSLILHWGTLRPDMREWHLPSRRPDGTTVYKNRALRMPFIKSGDNSTLRIEIDDPAVQAIEFLIFDEAQTKWFQNNGQNFQIQLQTSCHQGQGASGATASATMVPEDLV